MNFKDRGNKKWTAMMLIEHRQKLKELKESEKDRKKPILDDQEKDIINSKLQQALKSDLIVKLKYYKNKRFEFVSGKIRAVNSYQDLLVIKNSEEREKIKLNDLIDIEFL